MRKKHEPNIFNYVDYRKYLRDLYGFKKQESKHFSHRVFVRKCGFSSPNFLKLVMDGKRDLGKTALKKIVDALFKRKLDREYFIALTCFDQAKSNEERTRHLDTISRLRHRTKVQDISIDQYEYLSKWYYVAIREAVLLTDFSENASWINKILGTRLSPNTIKNAIDKLIKLGLLKRDSKNRLKQTDRSIVCDPKIFSAAVISYHKEMIERGMFSLEKSKSTHREISGVTFSLDEDTFNNIKEKINTFRQEVHAIASSAVAHEAVYQFNFQLFNLTEVKW